MRPDRSGKRRPCLQVRSAWRCKGGRSSGRWRCDQGRAAVQAVETITQVVNQYLADLRRRVAVLSASGVAVAAPQIGVRIAPGEITLTRIPRGESSEAITRAIARTPALLAA